MQEKEALLCLLALIRIQGIGPVTIRTLLQHFGTPQAIWHADPALLSPYLSKPQQAAWRGAQSHQQRCLQDAKRSLERALDAGITLLPQEDPRYPKLLKTLPNAPMILSVQGTLLPQDFSGIAIVGTRSASHYGLEMAYHFALELAKMGFTIVSGLARGIDTKAHEGALKAGRTLAFLGSGLLRIYPSENKALSSQITRQGALLSGFHLEAPPDRANFPQRNEIVTLLSAATVLIEAPLRSGGMLTAASARRLGRPLFALPGRIDQESFQGNHFLLKVGNAQLALTPSDVAEALGKAAPSTPQPSHQGSSLELPKDEAALLQLIGTQELCLDELALKCGHGASQLNVLLMRLLFKKKIKELPGKRYTRV